MHAVSGIRNRDSSNEIAAPLTARPLGSARSTCRNDKIGYTSICMHKIRNTSNVCHKFYLLDSAYLHSCENISWFVFLE